MINKCYEVFGIGNILVDYIAEVDDSKLKELGLEKGIMHLKERDYIHDLESKLKNIKKYPGGSVPNVVHGIANLNLSSSLAGSIAADKDGEFFIQNMVEVGIKNFLVYKEGNTGVSVSLVTPDGERTFVTNYSVTSDYTPRDLEEESVSSARYVHFSGYEFESMNKAVNKAVKLAKSYNTQVSFDLGDPNVVLRNKRKLKYFLRNVDIVFANEDEAKNFSGLKDPVKALDFLATYCKIPVVKIGKEGALVKVADKKYKVKGFNAELVNTIGAGDGFASGFLYGLCMDYKIIDCCKLGNLYASLVVEEEGARISYSMGNIDQVVKTIIAKEHLVEEL
ncbi:MAG: adenosine kinase [Nanoarchaeota archaeon]|nr:adenosine kinase [Nanoarchaeota archaeon]